MSVNIGGLNISYDYEDLINEIKQDLDEGLLKEDQVISIERGFNKGLSEIGYAPIIDYWYERVSGKEDAKVSSILEEMKKFNSIF